MSVSGARDGHTQRAHDPFEGMFWVFKQPLACGCFDTANADSKGSPPSSITEAESSSPVFASNRGNGLIPETGRTLPPAIAFFARFGRCGIELCRTVSTLPASRSGSGFSDPTNFIADRTETCFPTGIAARHDPAAHGFQPFTSARLHSGRVLTNRPEARGVNLARQRPGSHPQAKRPKQ